MTTNEEVAYGYESDEIKSNSLSFGLNAGVVFLKKFEWTPNGGKEGAEAEALDIVFSINGTEKGYRMFPVVKAFLKTGGETTDRNSPEFKEAVKNFNARVFHIMHCFVDKEAYQIALSKRITSFKDFCRTVAMLLPKDFAEIPLDCFLQYQWQPSQGQTRTFLELPKKMSYGKWLCKAVPGNWKKVAKDSPETSDREALYYINENGEKHPFVRNGWFMSSNFATQQITEDDAPTFSGVDSNLPFTPDTTTDSEEQW